MGQFKLRFILTAVIILSFAGHWECDGQTNNNFQKLSALDVQLQENFKIQEDQIGNLWMTTRDRVIKFNSVDTYNYSKFKGLPNSFTGALGDIFVDSQDNIWLGTTKGLFHYNPIADEFQQVNTNLALTGIIENFLEDEVGNILFTSKNGIWKLVKNSTLNEHKIIKLTKDQFDVNALLKVDKNIIIGAKEGLFVLKEFRTTSEKIDMFQYDEVEVTSILYTGDYFLVGTKKNGIYKLSHNLTNSEKVRSLPYHVLQSTITSFVQDPNNDIYIATDGAGLLHVNKNLELMDQHLTDAKNPIALSSNGIKNLYIDRHNIMWISTSLGEVNYLNLNGNSFRYLKKDLKNGIGLANNQTTTIAKDKNGNIWFGADDGISIWNPKTNLWKYLNNVGQSRLASNHEQIRDLQPEGFYMWIATDNGVYKVHIDSFLKAHYSKDTNLKTDIRNATSLCVDALKNIWIGGSDGKLSVVKANGHVKILPITGVTNLIGTFKGDVIAASPQGIYTINPKNFKINELKELSPRNKELPYFTVNSLAETVDRNLLIATNSTGIFLYNTTSGDIDIINNHQGLPSNIVQGLIVAPQGDIWASTKNGLANIQLNQEETNIRVFNKSDGLGISQFNTGSFASLNDQLLAFGGNTGVVIFEPNQIKAQLPSIPKLVLQNLESKNENKKKPSLFSSINNKDKIDLEYEDNTLSINFLGVLQSNPKEVKYSWKLEGLDDEWSKPSSQNSVQYANLSPGVYKFKVKTAGSSENWSPVQEITINVGNSLWTSNWAYMGYGLISVSLLLVPVYIRKLNIRKRKKQQKVEFYNNLTYEIKTPLKLLLTSLNKLAKEAGEENNFRIKNTVGKLNALFEPILNYDPNSKKKLGGTIITKIKLNDHIQDIVRDFEPLLEENNLEIIINDEWAKDWFYYNLDNLNIIVFNLISNSIKSSVYEGKIIINIFETNKGDLKIQIADNGSGIPKSQQRIVKDYYKTGREIEERQSGEVLSLIMVKDILEKCGGSINFESVENEGTTYRLILRNRRKDYVDAVMEKEIDEVLPQIEGVAENPDKFDCKILLVEDNEELRRILAKSLGKTCKIFESSNGKEALKIAAEVMPDVILADQILPELDGISMSNKLKKDPVLNNIPVFMMTDMLIDEEELNTSENGILEFIQKPINVNLFLQKIKEILIVQKHVKYERLYGPKKVNVVEDKKDEESLFVSNLEKAVLLNLHNSAFSENDLCTAMEMDRNSLYLKLKGMLDTTPLEFILNTKLQYAKSLLKKGEINFNDVATISGFNNPDTFVALFKKRFGHTPEEIYKEALNKM